MKKIEAYNKTAKQFYEHTKDLGDNLAEERNEFLKFIPKKGKILDLACGPGRDAKIFFDLGFEVTGIDLSPKMIEIAKKVAPKVDFKVMDMLKISFPDKTFDGAWFNAGLLTIEKEKAPRVLHEIVKVLKDKVVLLINAKEGKGEGWRFDKRYNINKFTAYYQEDELRQLVESEGFEVIKKIIKPQIQFQEKKWIEFICKKK